MFARSDLGRSAPTPPSENRALGALILIVCIVILLIVALSADAAIFGPLNATDSATQTWQADHPALPPGHPTLPAPINPDRNNQSPV